MSKRPRACCVLGTRAVVACAAAALAVACCASAGVVGASASAAPALSWAPPAPADASGGHPTGVSCPDTTLCVAVDDAGSVLTTADPSALAPAWTVATVDSGRELTAVSCASASLCVAVDSGGNALVSAEPNGGVGAWSSRPVDAGVAIRGVSCPTSSLCVAVDADGNALVSTEPARDVWHAPVPVGGGAALTGVACASASLCVAVDGAGGVAASGEPAAGARAWTRRVLDPAGGLTSVSCGASGVCVAVDATGDALASSDPTAASPTWSATGIDPGHSLAAVSCTPTGLCVGVDDRGSALASEAPAGPAPAWSLSAVDVQGLAAVSCATGSFCLTLDVGGRSSSAVLPSPPGEAAPALPPPVPRPAVVGTPALGSRLACQPGVPAGSPAQLSYAWLRETEPIAGADTSTYVVARGDQGRHLQCRVTATDAAGSASGTSAFVTVPFQGLPVAVGETVVGRARIRGRRVAVPIACSSRAAHGCAISLRLARVGASGLGATLGSRRAHVGRGDRVTVTVALSRAGRRLLSRLRRLRLALLVSGTVIGSIDAALAEQRLALSEAHGRIGVRVLADCQRCLDAPAVAGKQAGDALLGGGGAGQTVSRRALASSRIVAAGRAGTPYMGWDSYFAFGSRFSESTVLEQASDLLTHGLARRGYRYVWLDAGWWQGSRADDGQIELDRAQWPHGMAWLASTLHHAGLMFGVYTDAGADGCGGVGQGSYGHYRQDADTFAAWGVDAVKVDYCGGNRLGLVPAQAYREFRGALAATGRPMLLSICDFLQPGERGEGRPPVGQSAFSSYLFGPEVGNSWRTDGDVGVPGHVPFGKVLRNLDADAAHPQAAGPGHWNDPDYLGPDQGMGVQQFHTQVSMWAMLAAPLMVSRDLGRISAASLAALRNEAVIAIDQDPLGAQGTLVASEGDAQVWVKPLSDGSRAVALLNRGPGPVRIATSASGVGLAAAPRYVVRDLWRRRVSVTSGAFAAQVPRDGTVLLRVSPR